MEIPIQITVLCDDDLHCAYACPFKVIYSVDHGNSRLSADCKIFTHTMKDTRETFLGWDDKLKRHIRDPKCIQAERELKNGRKESIR